METINLGLNEIEFRKIKHYYIELCDTMNAVWAGIVVYLRLEDGNFNSEIFSEFWNSTDRKKYLNSKFIELNNIVMPGISSDALAGSDLLNVDCSPFFWQDIAYLENNAQTFIDQRINFAYPLSKLWNSKNNGFMLNDEFIEVLSDFCSNKAETLEQIEIAEQFISIVKCLNKLVNIGVLIPGTWDETLDFIIDVNRSGIENPFSLNRNLFYYRTMRQYRQNSRQSGNITDIFI